jgi:phospholipase C
VLFVMYDENDGFFDHVAPPVPPAGTPGEFLTVSPLPADAQGVAGPIGLGVRVPMLVVSPFSRGGHVASEVFDHTSQLRFLEERFDVTAPNISAWRRKTVGDLTSTLQMGHPVPAAPALPSTADDTPTGVTALGCESSDVVEARDDQPPYPLPSPQQMPTQEPASAT